MAAFVQNIGTNAVGGSSGTTLAITNGGSAVTVGDTIHVWAQASTLTTTGWSCADSAGNTYTLDHQAVQNSDSDVLSWFSARVTTSLPNGGTITVTMPSTSYRMGVAVEFSGETNPVAFDAHADGTGDSTTPASGTSGTTAQAAEIAFGVIFFDNAGSLTSAETISGTTAGYTALASVQSYTAPYRSGILPYYQILSSTGTQSFGGTLGHTDEWIASVGTYKANTVLSLRGSTAGASRPNPPPLVLGTAVQVAGRTTGAAATTPAAPALIPIVPLRGSTGGAAATAPFAPTFVQPLPAGVLVSGRRAPRFKLAFYAPLTGSATPVRLSGIDLNPELTSLSFTRQNDGGDCALTAGYEQTSRFPNESVPHHFGRLQQPVDAPRFAHVVLSENGQPVWTGRLMLPERPGGRLAALQATGYAYTALADAPWISADPSVLTSGEILRQALSQAAPVFGIAEALWTDPGVPHALNSFGGFTLTSGAAVSLRYPRELLTQFLQEGTQSGLALRATTVRQAGGRMLLGLAPLIAPAEPDYRIDFTPDVSWKEDLSSTYGGVYVLHSGGSQQPVFVQNPLFPQSYNGLARTAYVNGGNLDDAGAAAFGQNWLTQNSVPAVSCTFTVGGSSMGVVEGMPLYAGGTRAPWLVKDGEYVAVGDQGVYPITKVSVDCSTLQATITLGQQDFGWERTVRLLRQSAAAYSLGNSPVTGARAF
jgi:hypothetical protein